MTQFKHFTEASFWCLKNCSQASVAGISPVLSIASASRPYYKHRSIPQTFAERVNERREAYPLLPDCGEKLETRTENIGRTQRDALRQILIFNLAGFRITMETCIWVFSERFD